MAHAWALCWSTLTSARLIGSDCAGIFQHSTLRFVYPSSTAATALDAQVNVRVNETDRLRL